MSELLGKLYEKRERDVEGVAADPDCDWSQTYPVLFTFLTCTSFKGRPRETGTLMLLRECGTCKAWVNDRHSGQSAFVSGKTYTDLFIAIEAGLAANSLEWRKSKQSGTNGYSRGGK